MKVYNWSDISKFNNDFEQGSGISVGSYDGLHVGHQKILQTLAEGCKSQNLRAGIFTFTRPLAGVKNPLSYTGDISSLEQRLKLFEASGVDFVILAEFTEEFARLSGEEFFKLLKDKINLKFITEGVDFRCGYKGSTDVKALQEFAKREGIETVFVKPVVASVNDNETVRVSSSIIRQLISEGKTKKAEELLGHHLS